MIEVNHQLPVLDMTEHEFNKLKQRTDFEHIKIMPGMRWKEYIDIPNTGFLPGWSVVVCEEGNVKGEIKVSVYKPVFRPHDR